MATVTEPYYPARTRTALHRHDDPAKSRRPPRTGAAPTQFWAVAQVHALRPAKRGIQVPPLVLRHRRPSDAPTGVATPEVPPREPV